MLYADRIHHQIQVLGNLPEPTTDAIVRSEELFQQLKKQLVKQPMAFHEVMEQLLLAPGLGYYSAGAQKIGAAGDFVTAPEISSFFGYALAQQCAQILKVTAGSILEFGAGLGTLARDILLQLEADNCLPENYFIVEISVDLRQRQQNKLRQEIPHLYPRISWLECPPEKGFNGIILANEVIDAMPVHLFEMTPSGATEMQVAITEEGDLCLQHAKSMSPKLKQWFARAEIQKIPLANGYTSEVNLAMESWIEARAKCLHQGLILIIDYGYPRHEYYRPERTQGTLLCYYQHHSHDRLLFLPGLQDITAHVDFTAIAESAKTSGLSVAGYTNQANFLIGCGILQMAELAAEEDIKKQIEISQQIKTLIMPESMGERFKVIALTRELPEELCAQLSGFSFSDQRQKL